MGILMLWALDVDNLRCLLLLISFQARLRLSLRPGIARSGPNSQHGIRIPLFVCCQTVYGPHTDDLAIVHCKQMLAGARPDTHIGAVNAPSCEFRLATLLLLGRAWLLFSQFTNYLFTEFGNHATPMSPSHTTPGS